MQHYKRSSKVKKSANLLTANCSLGPMCNQLSDFIPASFLALLDIVTADARIKNPGYSHEPISVPHKILCVYTYPIMP